MVAIRCDALNVPTSIPLMAQHDPGDTALPIVLSDGTAVALTATTLTATWWACDPIWTAGAQKVGLDLGAGGNAAEAVYDFFVRDV